MNSQANPPYFHANHQHQSFNLYQSMDEILYSSSSSTPPPSGATMADHTKNNNNTILYNLTLIRDKVHHLESLLALAISHHESHHHDSLPAIANTVQEIILSASSLMSGLHQISAAQSAHTDRQQFHDSQNAQHPHEQEIELFTHEINFDIQQQQPPVATPVSKKCKQVIGSDDDVVELEAADLLAKYTHYCQVCGKGFRRDANLRMHMRAHGDEYKTAAALTNPRKGCTFVDTPGDDTVSSSRKYSCPQEGCRWNRRHPKFQPLKSMICVKNHYKRSHCPKMYVCKRCNVKQFSVLSDLRTHEKHCGDLRWRCSCGTNFSRKDKLMGHVALFVGHTAMISNFEK